MVQSRQKKRNALHELGYKIFLDRYAQKDMTRSTLAVGDTVIVVVNPDTGQREIGKVTAMALPELTIQLLDGTIVTRDIEHVDKPLETEPEQMMDRVAAGIAATEADEAKRQEWTEHFRWLLDDWKFVPGGRILTAAGTDQLLSYYNCYVLKLPHDSRGGILKTLGEMTEIMSRGGGVGITLSSLRPRHAYVKGVNGRSSGSVSWGALYSFVTGLIEQGGCLTPDTLVFTENGLLRLDEIVQHSEKGWREQNLRIMTDEGVRLSRQVYSNGLASVLKVTTDMGITITGTPNHKVKVMTNEGPQWRQLDQLHSGDAIMVKLGQHTGKFQALKQPTYHHHNQDEVQFPTTLDEELAFFLGYFMGDGFMTGKDGDWRLGVSIAHNSYLMEAMPELLQRLFSGVNVRIQQKPDDASATLIVSNRAVKEFLSLNGFAKRQSSEVAVPRLIRMSPPAVVGAFLRGLFEADGGISHHYPTLISTSKQLIDETTTLLIGLGCPVKVEQHPHSDGKNPMWRLRIHSFRGLESWRQNIGCDPRSRFADCMDFQPDMAREHSYGLPQPNYWLEPVFAGTTVQTRKYVDASTRVIATDSRLRRKLLRYSRGDRNFTLSAYTSLSEQHRDFATFAPPTNDTWFVFVDEVTHAGQSLTLDLEVDDNHTYLANGLVTHNSRRGALMLLLPDWHPDVIEFITSKREAGKITNANISVAISDAFMDAVKADGNWELRFPDTGSPEYDELWDGDLDKWEAAGGKVHVYRTMKARELWHIIIESAWASAEPGLFFIDRYNKMSNSWYHSRIVGVNPCVTGDTRIYTNKGLRRAVDLFNDETDIAVAIDGRFGLPFATTPATRVFRTGRKAVYRLQTEEGYFVRATADHRIMTPRGWVELQDLSPGDKVHILNRKGGFGTEGSLEEGRILGWYIGDGHMNEKNGAVLSFFGEEKAQLAPVFADYVNQLVEPETVTQRSYPVGVSAIADRDEARVSSKRLLRIIERYGLVENKFQVPEAVFRGSEAMQRGFLQALFTADGGVQGSVETGLTVRLASNELELLEAVQMLLLNFGIASCIYRERRIAGYRMMPDSSRQLKQYWCEAQHELVIRRTNLQIFAREVNFLMREKSELLSARLNSYKSGAYAESYIAKVAAITFEGEEDVYDLTEPLTHSFISNGITIHNCGEQGLPGDGVCNLGALNLAKFYDEINNDVAWDDLKRAVRYAVRFLDNVIDANHYFREENAAQQFAERRVGLGTMGIAELMLNLGIRYGSDHSVEFINRLYGMITTTAYETSSDIAAEKGAFPYFEAEKFLESGFMQQMPDPVRERIAKQGIRNVTLLTQAPTGTTGTLVNTSTGIEPFFSWVYYRKSRLGLHEEQVPVVKEWFDANPGTTQLPDYFVTAMELSPEDHVKVQAAFQRWIDSSISKTSNVPNEWTVEQVAKLYEQMYDLGCKGGTIYRDGSRDEQVLMLKGDDRAEKEMQQVEAVKQEPTPAPKVEVKTVQADRVIEQTAQVATPHRVYPRPGKLQGVTVSRQTPFGTAYITMNSDEHGYPFEVFITVGKAGSDLQADAESLGRMISLSLRTTAPHNRLEMMKLIIDQLENIGGARPMGMGPNRVISLPDSVAKALQEHYFAVNQPQQLGLFNGEGAPNAALPEAAPPALKLHTGVIAGADICPSCGTASLVKAEGCEKCLTCEYTRC